MDEPLLLTPGPLTTAPATREAMLRDWGSRDPAFIALIARVHDQLLGIAHARDTHVCVPVQGSGTFAVEAALGTLVGRRDRALVAINGAYGQRMARILALLGRDHVAIETPETVPVDPAAIDARLAGDPTLSHVVVVHCETTTGLLNPIDAIAGVVAARGRRLIIDAMSAFGALKLNARTTAFDAVIASSNKCLEGVPGLGFAIVRRASLAAAEGNAHSLALDLHDQWRGFERTGQYRFTPPTHVIAALAHALDELEREGGVVARGARYARNCHTLVTGMRALGFHTILPDELQAPIIVTFARPRAPGFAFEQLYDGLRARGFAIYPGKLTTAPSFRIGCIGHIDQPQIEAALDAVRATLADMGIDPRSHA